LYEVLQKEERFYSENGVFTTNVVSLGYAAPLKNPHRTHVVTMAVGATGSLNTSVNVTATALNDGKCLTMTLANSQQTSATGTDPATCW
jgi:Tfp pilus assembly protein PilE